MKFFKSALFRLGVWRPSRLRPIALDSSTLSKLPPELILHITRFLPPESALSFSLCFQPIYFILGTQYLKALQESEQWDRFKFLTLLKRELPNYIACYYCKRLHAINEAHRHHYSNRGYYSGYLFCWEADLEVFTGLFIHIDFSFTIFQMAMKNHRQGLDCSKLLSLLSYKTDTYFREGYVKQFTALAQIVASSMLIRQQTIFMIPSTQKIPIPWDLSIHICPHIQVTPLKSFRYWDTSPTARWDEPKVYQKMEGVTQCNYCLTEFQIDFKSFGECGNAMFVTKWQDLGEGRSPLDHKWQSHVGGGRKGKLWLPVEFNRSSICTAFEQKEHFRFEFDSLLTLQNKKELFRKSPYPWPKSEFDSLFDLHRARMKCPSRWLDNA